MKRILVTGASNIGKAGVATIVYKWGQAFDSNEIVYDYLMQRGLPDDNYCEHIKEKGGKIYTCQHNEGILSILRWIKKVVKDNGYHTIHINTDTAYIAAAYIYMSKRGGCKHVFVHSHCTQVDDKSWIKRWIKTVLHKICIPYVRRSSEKYLACSRLAGEWMFGKKYVDTDKYQTIYNGVEPEKYLYNIEIRKRYRRKFGWDEKLIIANIGRFSYQKNQSYLIDVFYRLHKDDLNSLLVLVGEGEFDKDLRKKVQHLGIEEYVLFLGLRNDIPQLMNAFDILVMPSRFEGLPVTMVEAQMAELPCVVSDNITYEAKFTENVKYVELIKVEKWIESINSFKNKERGVNTYELLNSKFNIYNAATELQKILLRTM